MSPPETNAISLPSGAIAGSANAGLAAGVDWVWPRAAAVTRDTSSARVMMAGLYIKLGPPAARALHRGWRMTPHTATGEWKSFERRMRQRRVDRLLLRADVAMEYGCHEDARDCLAEARQLAPELP